MFEVGELNMSNDISVAIITGVFGLIAGSIITYLGAIVGYRKELEIEYDKELRRARVEVYSGLWQELSALARYDSPKPKTTTTLIRLSKEMREWYFVTGGIFLSEESRKPYFELKKALEEQTKQETQDKESQIPEEQWQDMVDIASLLRSSLAKDIGARRKPPVGDS
jgi:hypothetical protein